MVLDLLMTKSVLDRIKSQGKRQKKDMSCTARRKARNASRAENAETKTGKRDCGSSEQNIWPHYESNVDLLHANCPQDRAIQTGWPFSQIHPGMNPSCSIDVLATAP